MGTDGKQLAPHIPPENVKGPVFDIATMEYCNNFLGSRRRKAQNRILKHGEVIIMKKASFLVLVVVCCLLLGGCTSNSFRSTFFMRDEKGMINSYFDDFISAINRHDAPAIRSLFATSISANCDSLTEQIESAFSYFPDGLVVTGSATGVYSSYEMGKKRRGEIEALFMVEADGQVFYAAMKICSEDSVESENIGIVSIYFINSQNYHSDVYYHGDGQWTPGINLQ